MNLMDKTVAEERVLSDICAELGKTTGYLWTFCRMGSSLVFFDCRELYACGSMMVLEFPYPEFPSRHIVDGGVKGTVTIWDKYEYSQACKGAEATVEKIIPTTWGTRMADSVKAISEHFATR